MLHFVLESTAPHTVEHKINCLELQNVATGFIFSTSSFVCSSRGILNIKSLFIIPFIGLQQSRLLPRLRCRDCRPLHIGLAAHPCMAFTKFSCVNKVLRTLRRHAYHKAAVARGEACHKGLHLYNLARITVHIAYGVSRKVEENLPSRLHASL